MPNRESRRKAIETASDLFRRQGYAATGLTQVIEQSGTPKGSFYFNFPGGKEELGLEAVRLGGTQLHAAIQQLAAASPDAASFVRTLGESLAASLESSDFQLGCPIATVALEVASTNEPLRLATAEVFQSWLDGWATSLERWGGIEPERARTLALELLGAMEGAFVLSRALKSPEPMLVAGAAAVARLREALADG